MTILKCPKNCQCLANIVPIFNKTIEHQNRFLVTQIMAAADLDDYDLMNCFGRSDSPAYQIATMLLAELNTDGIMGNLYVESLTQALVVHLLRYYTRLPPRIVYLVWTAPNRPTFSPIIQQAIDYIHEHLNGDLSMAQIASSVNISPTYFASLFKKTTGISLHQYVISQRVERAKLLLSKNTDLTIANIASQVGFSSQSHLNYHYKRLTGMTPKQFTNSKVVS
jgi:AraC family transcriptional regulator